jgi:thiol-disulfide isomerase/thioredoxin
MAEHSSETAAENQSAETAAKTANNTDSASDSPSYSSSGSNDLTDSTTVGKQLRNLLIVVVATVLTVAVFFGVRTQATTASLETLAEESVPLEVALTNGKPTLMEFYANWCASCQAMAEDIGELKDAYADQLNFVMLNVDNSKWLPEMLHYRVDGIPHFVFLNAAGDTVASTIGEQPRSVMASNLEALMAGKPLPHAQSRGQTSVVESSPLAPGGPTDPRSHGSQVVEGTGS